MPCGIVCSSTRKVGSQAISIVVGLNCPAALLFFSATNGDFMLISREYAVLMPLRALFVFYMGSDSDYSDEHRINALAGIVCSATTIAAATARCD